MTMVHVQSVAQYCSAVKQRRVVQENRCDKGAAGTRMPDLLLMQVAAGRAQVFSPNFFGRLLYV